MSMWSTMSGEWALTSAEADPAVCSNPPAESCSDAACPVHGLDDRCPDCGRATCTGEDCYWPEDAGLRPPDDRL